VPTDHVAGDLLTGRRQGDDIVRSIVDELSCGECFERTRDRRVADVEILRDVLRQGRLFCADDVKDRLDVVLEAGAEGGFGHGRLSKSFRHTEKFTV